MNKILTSVSPVLLYWQVALLQVVQPAALDSIHERPSLVRTETVDHVLDRLSYEGRRRPVSLADLMQPLPHLGMDHQQPPDHQVNITNALCRWPPDSGRFGDHAVV
jgi:hypothetical protein